MTKLIVAFRNLRTSRKTADQMCTAVHSEISYLSCMKGGRAVVQAIATGLSGFILGVVLVRFIVEKVGVRQVIFRVGFYLSLS